MCQLIPSSPSSLGATPLASGANKGGLSALKTLSADKVFQRCLPSQAVKTAPTGIKKRTCRRLKGLIQGNDDIHVAALVESPARHPTWQWRTVQMARHLSRLPGGRLAKRPRSIRSQTLDALRDRGLPHPPSLPALLLHEMFHAIRLPVRISGWIGRADLLRLPGTFLRSVTPTCPSRRWRRPMMPRREGAGYALERLCEQVA